MRQEETSFEIRLRNAEGVPIVQLGGYVTKAALSAIRSTLERLAGAGHYNIVLNLERAQAPDWRCLGVLARTIRSIRQHYGSVELIADQENWENVLRVDRVARLFRVSQTEGEAISRIKKLRRAPDGISDTSARLKQ